MTVTPPPTDTTGASSGSPMNPGLEIALLLFAASAFIGGITLIAPVRARRR